MLRLSNIFKSGINKMKLVMGVNNKGSFYNTNSEDKIKGFFGLWCGIGFIIGCNGAIIEHDRINRYAYNQYRVSDFGKFMLSVDGHVRAVLVYGGVAIYYPFISLFNVSYLQAIENIRLSGWLHSKKVDIIFPDM